jgi:hypothetical protein
MMTTERTDLGISGLLIGWCGVVDWFETTLSLRPGPAVQGQLIWKYEVRAYHSYYILY